MYLPILWKLLKWFFLTKRIEGEKNALMAKAMANLTEKPLVKNATRGPTLQCKIGLFMRMVYCVIPDVDKSEL